MVVLAGEAVMRLGEWGRSEPSRREIGMAHRGLEAPLAGKSGARPTLGAATVAPIRDWGVVAGGFISARKQGRTTSIISPDSGSAEERGRPFRARK